MHQLWRNKIIKIMVLLHSADGVAWQSPPKGISLKTLSEAEEQGFILIRGEFQKRQFRLTELGSDYVERDKRRLEARRL
jgi:DNA-binding PadR family transcriptional regulator